MQPGKVGKMKEILFRETSSIGLRQYGLTKSMLRREMVVVHTAYGDVEVKTKLFEREGGQ
jgi:uncharacterized protein (DUF111 family)